MLVVFVEEPSMKAALDHLLPKAGVDADSYQIISFQGVSNMMESLPRRLRAWRDPRAHFLILRDNDGGNCRDRKELIRRMCERAGKIDKTKIRIVCQELEAWFLGDLEAIDSAKLGKPIKTAAMIKKCREPDEIIKPSQALREHFGFYAKIEGARRIAEHLSIERNVSQSFGATIAAIREIKIRIKQS